MMQKLQINLRILKISKVEVKILSKQYIIAHDLGTSGDKAALFDENGQLICSSTYNYTTYYPRTNWAEQNPDDWWKAVCLSTKDVLQKSKIRSKDVACITFSGQMMGCLPIDKNGNCLRNSIIWADARATEETQFLKNNMDENNFYHITGTSIAPNYSLEKIMWIKKNENDIYNKTVAFLNAKDYMVFKLTGKLVTDYSDASGTNMFDIKNKNWSDEIIHISQIDKSKLPELHASTDIVGNINLYSEGEIGLTSTTKVVIGGGDGPCATVGAGAVEEGDIYNYFGSSSWISVTSKEPMFDSKQRTFNLCHLDPDLYMCPGTMQSAGGSYEWMKDTICKMENKISEISEIEVFEIIDSIAKKSPPGANNLMFLPYLMGERCPYWNPDAKAAFIGLTRKHTREDIIRSVYEGPIFNLRIILDLFKEQGVKVSNIRAIGGAVESNLISGIMADIFEVNIVRSEMAKEATSFGAAICGGVGIGLYKDFKIVKDLIRTNNIIKPQNENIYKYRQLYPIFKKAYEALVEVNKSLSDVI